MTPVFAQTEQRKLPPAVRTGTIICLQKGQLRSPATATVVDVNLGR